VWAHRADRARHVLEQGDVEEDLNAASQIGDDRLQMKARGASISSTAAVVKGCATPLSYFGSVRIATT